MKDNIGEQVFKPALSCVDGSTYEQVLENVQWLIYIDIYKTISCPTVEKVYPNVCRVIRRTTRRRIAHEQR